MTVYRRRAIDPGMKVVLDLTQLLEEGKITQAEYDRFLALSARGTGSLAFNILVGFGVIAVSGGAIAIVPSPITAVFLGAIIAAAGVLLRQRALDQWGLLGTIAILTGSLLVGGAILALNEGSVQGVVMVTTLFGIAAIAAKSGLLVTLSLLGVSALLGAQTAYWHATYAFGTNRPTLTVAVFAALAIGLYQISKLLRSDYQRLALIAARVSVFFVNLGFWIGSLWGDELSENFGIAASAFTFWWAVALVGTGVWAARANRRWVVNTCATFGAIHFYTQYFETIGASPGSILLAGLLAIGIALGIAKYNREAKSRS